MGKGRDKQRRREKKLKRKGLLPEAPVRERPVGPTRERPPDDSNRFANLSARGTKFGFRGNGVRVPFDPDAGDPATQLVVNTLSAHLGAGKGSADA